MRLLLVVVSALASISLVTAPASADVAAHGCGAPLAPEAVATILRLADTSTLRSDTPLAQLDDEVDRHRRITDILAAHRDRRGLFSVGLDTVEFSAVVPLQHGTTLRDRVWSPRISLVLLRRYLEAVRAHFSGAPTTAPWTNFFTMAARCEVSGGRVAMAGYNAHITYDLAYALAEIGTRPEHAPDFFAIVDTIAQSGPQIVERTKAAYGVDIGPLFRFYFVGEGLDLLVGKGVATGAMLRAADVGYNTITFANGLALQDPALRDAAAAEVFALWQTGEAAMETLAYLRGL